MRFPRFPVIRLLVGLLMLLAVLGHLLFGVPAPYTLALLLLGGFILFVVAAMAGLFDEPKE
jgi:hypothetical protein